MFLGHYAVALGAKKAAPKTSLGTLVLAAQFADLLWPVLLLAGLEHVRIAPGVTVVTPLDFADYPISHSLTALLGWALLGGGLYWLIRRTRAAWVVAAAVVSHWVLDFVVHRSDLPVYPGAGPRLGLGLWNSLPATLAVEFGLFALGIFLYVHTTVARDGIGRYAFWALVAVLGVLYLGALFGPPPPDVTTLATTALAGWLFVLWGYWVDRHRASPAARGSP